MLKIGITGGIGSGKTTVAKVFESIGIPVYYADEQSKWLQSNNIDIIENTKKLLGEESYLSNGAINRKFIAEKVFSDNSLLQKLNQIIHPIVKEDFSSWILSHLSKPYILKESAISFETGIYKELDKTILVTCPIETRVKRVLKRDKNRSEEEIRNIIKKQMPDEEKLKLADYVLVNDDSQLIVPQILTLHENIIKMTLTS